MDLNTQEIISQKKKTLWVGRNHCVAGCVILYLTKVGNVLGILTIHIPHKIEPQ